MKKQIQTRAFTLIELLVVITIIGILASIAVPVYNGVIENAKQTKALAQGKQVALACKLYAADFDGRFPNYVWDATNETEGSQLAANANMALRALTGGGYCPQEKMFYTPGSRWCNPSGPDEQMKGDDNLAPGENGWGYAAGLNDTSHPSWPLLFDGPDEGLTNAEGAHYTANGRGGVWRDARKAIVLRVDQSGATEMVVKGNRNYVPRNKATPNKNLIAVDRADNWLTGARLLIPEPPAIEEAPVVDEAVPAEEKKT